MNEIDDAIGQAGREVRPEVQRSVLAQASRRKHARIALADRQLDIGISFVVAKKNVVARLLLLDQVVLERQRFLLVVDDDVVDIDRLAQQSSGLGVLGGSFQKIRPQTRAQVLRLAHVDDLTVGVLVQVHAGRGGDRLDFLVKVHGRSCRLSAAGFSSQFSVVSFQFRPRVSENPYRTANVFASSRAFKFHDPRSPAFCLESSISCAFQPLGSITSSHG